MLFRAYSSLNIMVIIAGAAGGLAIGACGLSIAGTGATIGDVADGTVEDAASSPNARDAEIDPSDALEEGDAAHDAGDAAPPCTPLGVGMDGGIVGRVDTGTMMLQWDASPDELRHGLISLTESEHHQRGAAWSPNVLPPLRAFEASFTLRVGPNDTAGDGIAFAVLGASAPPGPGEDGSGLGLRGVGAPGFVVAIDMFHDSNDATDDGDTTLKLIAMPSFEVIAHAGHAESLNDGELHRVDVSLAADGTLAATLHGRMLTTTVRHVHEAFRVPSPAILGVTAATGAMSNSHNEVAAIAITGACR